MFRREVDQWPDPWHVPTETPQLRPHEATSDVPRPAKLGEDSEATMPVIHPMP